MKIAKLFVAGWVAWFLFCLTLGLSLLGLGLYVAYHFISKVW